MRTSWRFLAALAAAGCIGDLPARPCDSDDECVRDGIGGRCTPSPSSGESYCVFPATSCPNGMWGQLAGDGLAMTCWTPVFDGAPSFDAPMTVPPDADPSTPDAAEDDAALPPDAEVAFDAEPPDAPPLEPDAVLPPDAPPPDARPDAAPLPPDAPGGVVLQVTISGTGAVLVDPAGTSCGTSCYRFSTGTDVTLTPASSAGKRFNQWKGGGCATFAATCTIDMTADTTVTARFEGGALLVDETLTTYRILSVDGTPSGGHVIAGLADADTFLGDGGMIPKDSQFVAMYGANRALSWKSILPAVNARVIAATPDGGVVVAGFFRGTVAFGPDQLTATNDQMFVAKYTSTGAHGWAVGTDGSGSAAVAVVSSLAVATDGAIVIGGQFFEELTFHTSGHDLEGRPGVLDGFVVRYEATGSPPAVAYARAFDVTTSGVNVALAANGTIAVGMTFTGTLSFGGTNYAAQQRDAIALRIDAGGSEDWALHISESPNAQFEDSARVAFDASNNLFVGVPFSVPLNLGDGVRTPTGSDVVLAKYSPSRTLLWSKKFGGAANEVLHELFVRGDHLFMEVRQRDVPNAQTFTIEGWIMSDFNSHVLVSLDLNGWYRWSQPFFGYPNALIRPAASGQLLLHNLQPAPFFWQLLSP